MHIRDDTPAVSFRGEILATDFIERDFLGPGDLDDTVQRLLDREGGECCSDVVGCNGL